MAAELADHINEGLGHYDQLIGVMMTQVSETTASAEVLVRDELKQPYGLVHGGVHASIAESLASWATAAGVRERGLAVGVSSSTSFLRPITEGTIHVLATRIHGGRTTWIWDVEFRDDDDRLCAVTRMTIAVRPSEVLTPST